MKHIFTFILLWITIATHAQSKRFSYSIDTSYSTYDTIIGVGLGWNLTTQSHLYLISIDSGKTIIGRSPDFDWTYVDEVGKPLGKILTCSDTQYILRVRLWASEQWLQSTAKELKSSEDEVKWYTNQIDEHNKRIQAIQNAVTTRCKKCQDNRNETVIGYNPTQYDTNNSSKTIIGYDAYHNGDAGLDQGRDAYNTTYYRMSSSSKTMFICGTDTIYTESPSKDLSIKKNKSTVAGWDNLFIKIIIISICVAILVLYLIFWIWIIQQLSNLTRQEILQAFESKDKG